MSCLRLQWSIQLMVFKCVGVVKNKTHRNYSNYQHSLVTRVTKQQYFFLFVFYLDFINSKK